MALAAVAAAFTLVACEPGNGMSTAAVAITTDQKGTSELEKRGVDVQWLTCTATYGEKDGRTVTSPSVNSVASVNCTGETGDGQDIGIKGKVTQEVNGTCVRGDLTATVGGKEVFRLNVLGNCRAGTQPAGNRTTPPGGPGATVTVTETVTRFPDPTCSCFQGK
ncbi:hypothetical protein QFZ75_005142 [Streptomyces sp. V3I8]|jgi:hypothetical protein|uniref:hypothetical protein n=1 Tax=Streptomyces sp. V3I8 TaxID=3042279 RepID=UPI0027883C8C|nr:hypothetical protein [Streptomyces sp. V3I8]MDQ1038726.1 hypothetical protein [Streptomyces sp. V3I8]